MKTKRRKLRADELLNRKPWQRLDEVAKMKVVRDVTIGHVGYREASRKYHLSRNTIKKWVAESSVAGLLKSKEAPALNTLSSEMKESSQDKLLQVQVKQLTCALEQAKLKAEALETMIIVAEEELKIKIRKKRGTPQSIECVKAALK